MTPWWSLAIRQIFLEVSYTYQTHHQRLLGVYCCPNQRVNWVRTLNLQSKVISRSPRLSSSSYQAATLTPNPKLTWAALLQFLDLSLLLRDPQSPSLHLFFGSALKALITATVYQSSPFRKIYYLSSSCTSGSSGAVWKFVKGARMGQLLQDTLWRRIWVVCTQILNDDASPNT